MTQKQEYTDSIIRGLVARLEMDADLGLGHMPLSGGIGAALQALRSPSPAASLATSPRPAEAALQPPRSAPPAQPPRPAPPVSTDAVRPPSGRFRTSVVPVPEIVANPAKESALAALRESCMACEECELCQRRNSVVWGEGSLDAQVMFIGEGPGRDEDNEGRPFVGRSGRLLTDIIEKGMKTPRGGVYIANVVKCRPPGNRDPKPEEVEACSRYLRAQIDAIAPKVIVAVGGVAGCALLGLPPRSPGLRGKWHQYAGIPMRVIYHPSYLLRQRGANDERTSADRDTWKDIQDVMARLGDS